MRLNDLHKNSLIIHGVCISNGVFRQEYVVVLLFFKLIIAEGTTGGFNESGIDGNAFIDGQALAFELSQDFRVELVHGLF